MFNALVVEEGQQVSVTEVDADRLPEGDVTVTVDGPDCPREVLGDPVRFRQILTNLIDNAIKFSRGGEVGIRLWGEGNPSGGDGLRVEVRDTGVGIPADQLSRIFDEFTQVDESMTRLYGGAGLGLSIARDLVVLMDGRIGVHSELGVGTTFWFWLPLAHAAAEGGEADEGPGESERRTRAEPSETEDASTLRVLLVEDDSTNQEVATLMLQKLGCKVDIAADGQEALMLCETQPYDAVFMDCQMPVLDGYSATERIRGGSGINRDVPIIAMTAHAVPGHRERCLGVGMDDHVTKPIKLKVLAQALERAV